MEWIVGSQNAGLGDDMGTGFADHVVKLASFLVGVVGQVAGPHLHIAFEIVEKDVAAGAHIAGVLVEIDLVCAEQHLRVLDFSRHGG